MKTYQNRLRGARLAVIAVALLAVPALAMAQTDQQSPQRHAATTYAKKHTAARHRQPYIHRNLYGWDQRSARDGCQYPYQNQFPPCMSTWPQGSPHYHGPRSGPTFFDEQ